MHATLINPNLLVQRDDPFTTGIVYMPIGLASVAASLRDADIAVDVVDAFAEHPKQMRYESRFKVLGLPYPDTVSRVPSDTEVVILYANQITNHLSLLGIVRQLKSQRPHLPVVVLENTQAVTAYALNPIAEQLFRDGVDYVLTGEAEHSAALLVRAIASGDASRLSTVPGLQSPAAKNPVGPRPDLDILPFPAWDLFPLQNYWNLRFAHGPQSSDRYLPLLTSRGCPYSCRFCVVPATNKRKWRSRSPESVVVEMRHMRDTFGVREFHVEDLNPTVDDRRIHGLCRQLIEERLGVSWKLVAGTKVETMRNEETIDMMAAAGCRYISISPETGSPHLLKLMQKPFRVDHAVKLIHRMNKVGIRSQACFVLGFPGETEEDLRMTRRLVHDLTWQGVDEIALFIIAPVPGSAVFDELQGYESLSELNFTPTWREDYPRLSRLRLQLYREFLIRKTLRYPGKIAWQAMNFLRRRFETKMEMVPYRALVYRWLRPTQSALSPARAIDAADDPAPPTTVPGRDTRRAA